MFDQLVPAILEVFQAIGNPLGHVLPDPEIAMTQYAIDHPNTGPSEYPDLDSTQYPLVKYWAYNSFLFQTEPARGKWTEQ